ncbi:MAG: hypothetical protein ACXVCY_09455 [Pseudobdellovibrionaceae bacterium]
MLKVTICLLLILGTPVVKAENAKPVSVSYENLLLCFPELRDQKLSFKVDLNRLKELVDEKFVTVQSEMRQRKVLYVGADGKTMSLTYQNKYLSGKKVNSQLILEKIDEKGVYTDVKLPENQTNNPKQEVINNLLLYVNIKSDDYSYYDTKLNGVYSTYDLNFKDVQDYELIDAGHNRSVLCEKKSQLGIICTCSKK